MDIRQLFSVSRSLVTETTWEKIQRVWNKDPDPDRLFLNLSAEKASLKFPEHLPDLMRLEWAIYQTQRRPSEFSSEPEKLSLNPFLQVLPLSWKNLPLLLKAEDPAAAPPIEPGPEWVLIWQELVLSHD